MNYYRFHEIRWTESKLLLVKSEFIVTKETEKGVWIDVYGRPKFVLSGARKKFACPTEAEALESYYARKRRQVRILKHQLAAAESALTLSPTQETVYFGLDFGE